MRYDGGLMHSWRPLVLLGGWVLGCQESLPPHQLAARTRAAVPRCRDGEAAQCSLACKGNGPNATCRRACEAGDGASCVQLGARLERGAEVPDPEAPPGKIPVDDDGATDAYARACKLKVPQGCRVAASRILNGQVDRKRDAGAAPGLLRAGCDQLQDPESCCMMAHLNFRLAQSRTIDIGVDFRSEGRKWVKIARAYGGACPLPPGMNP